MIDRVMNTNFGEYFRITIRRGYFRVRWMNLLKNLIYDYIINKLYVCLILWNTYWHCFYCLWLEVKMKSRLSSLKSNRLSPLLFGVGHRLCSLRMMRLSNRHIMKREKCYLYYQIRGESGGALTMESLGLKSPTIGKRWKQIPINWYSRAYKSRQPIVELSSFLAPKELVTSPRTAGVRILDSPTAKTSTTLSWIKWTLNG